MSDRSSAELFATLFKRIARGEPDDERRARLALDVWRMSRSFDFHPVQMGIESTLAKLGLARNTGGEDEFWVYGPARKKRARKVDGGEGGDDGNG